MAFDYSIVLESLPVLIGALLVTLKLTGCILLLGLLLALPVALANVSGNNSLYYISEFYILVFRGTPALVQLFIVYFGLSQFEFIRESFVWPVLREAFWCAVIALGMNSGAYTARMFAGALRNVPTGYVEAAQALGLSPIATFTTIKAPIAIRMILPTYGNEVILTLKATALASAITLQELMGRAELIVSETYAPYEVYISVGIIYLALTTIIGQGFAFAEKRLSLSDRTTAIKLDASMDTAK